MKRIFPRFLLMLSMLFTTSLMADTWAPPGVESYESADGTWKLTIYPRVLTSQLGYFKDKVAGKQNAGGVPGDTQKSPIGHMQHLQDGQWRTAWKLPLVNDVSPVSALVSNGGVTVTLDNWHSVGWGDDAVAIYAADGRRIRKFGLSSFLPKYYIHTLPRSVSSIHWHGEPSIDEAKQQLVIPVTVPTPESQEWARGDETGSVDVHFRLSDGEFVPQAGDEWTSALDSARQANERRKEREAEARARFIAPLLPPGDGDTRAWYDYLIEAFFRLGLKEEYGYPGTEVVPLRNDPKFDLLAGYLGDALSDDLHQDGVLMLASPSQDVLAEVIAEKAAHAKPGFLATTRIYVAADDAHMPAIRKALARTGAEVIQLDINTQIPQRKERLERYLRKRARRLRNDGLDQKRGRRDSSPFH